ncbi:hypothetical protein AVEN_151658-1 [Araneus ventricosus]|uniref:Uncharacterized protein n=1 Tax=Araneus ventricosus TaxID=182803 RepID=A0A4Y2JSM4_ARAVE|nr:hypothetical protein AVEN_151658-1 [Araneus ventricosus]
MDKGIRNDFTEQSEISSISKTEISEEDTLRAEIAETRIRSSPLPNIETFSFTSPIVADGSSECLFEEIIVPNPVVVKTDSIVTSTTKIRSLESAVELSESAIDAELLESINLQTEETEEMLDMISRAKEKLEFFIFHVEDFGKSLQEISKHSDANSKRGNTYLKNIYRKKLVEFASGLLDKVKKSVKDVEADYETLKEHEKKTAEAFQKITEFHRSFSVPCTAEIGEKSAEKLKETVDHLAEELYSLKPKQLSEIKKVSYIETDIEMLYDLYRRFSSIGDTKSGFNCMQQSA